MINNNKKNIKKTLLIPEIEMDSVVTMQPVQHEKLISVIRTTHSSRI